MAWSNDYSGLEVVYASAAFMGNSGSARHGLSSAYSEPPGTYRNTYNTRRTESITWYRCPFCGKRQNIEDDGPDCRHCGGDVLSEGVA